VYKRQVRGFLGFNPPVVYLTYATGMDPPYGSSS